MDKYIAALYPEKGFYTSILPQMKVTSNLADLRSKAGLKFNFDFFP